MKKKIVILGALGQDGKLLSTILEDEKYEIFGICRENTEKSRIDFHEKNFNTKIYKTDLTKFDNVNFIFNKINPDIIVNFCGVTDVFDPWSNMDFILEQNCIIPLNILKYIKEKNPEIFLFQSSSSLMYGRSQKIHVSHNSNFAPIYPYGITKLFAHNLINEFRQNYNIECSSGVFFNHESQYRGKNFLTKKVSNFISKLIKGEKGILKLGNLSSKRDISHAIDFMYGVKLIIEKRLNDDFMFSSMKLTKTEDLVKLFFTKYGYDMNEFVIQDDNLLRKYEPCVYGDDTKLALEGWKRKKTLDDLVEDMVEFELNNNNFIY
jgi:GDPmannose 4,6-dehydratase